MFFLFSEVLPEHSFLKPPRETTKYPHFGARQPIPSTRFSLLSYRQSLDQTSTYAIYWKTSGASDFWPDGSQFGASFDGYYFGPNAFHTPGFEIKTFDLNRPSFEVQQGAWQGNIVALRIDPSVGSGVGTQVKFDWIRLVDPQSAPIIPIRWQSSNLSSEGVITVWLDTDNHGFNGTAIARYARSPLALPLDRSKPFSTSPNLPLDLGEHLLHSASLPPGNYHVYLSYQAFSLNGPGQATFSNYSAPIRIQQAPSGYFLSPSTTSGKDYAGFELANPWDMSDRGDIINLIENGIAQLFRQFSQETFSAGVFSALSDLPVPGNSETDAQVWLNVAAERPIETSRYRYLSYRLKLESPGLDSISARVGNGWVSRLIHWNNDLFGDGGRTKAHVVYEGFHTYVVDLWDSDTVEEGLRWQALPSIRHIRIDPLETSVQSRFFLDWVRLNSENSPQNGNFNIKWMIEDSDSNSIRSTLFYDKDQQGFKGVRIAHFPALNTGQQSYQWNTTQIPPGRYYLYLTLDDGHSQRSVYAKAPLVIDRQGGSSNLATRVPLDYKGDGISERAIYRRNFEQAFYISGSRIVTRNPAQIQVADLPIEGDFDGDKISDLAWINIEGDLLRWNFRLSSSGQFISRYWGFRGDRTAVADYNGDGQDEMGIYRNGSWFLLHLDGKVEVFFWGQQNDIPVPADYDGDGRDDIAIWRPSSGNWWILNSGFSSGRTSAQLLLQQWGLPGDIPLPADFDSDGISELCVWRPGNGTWYIKNTRTQDSEITQWGLANDIPILGDFNGDGLNDFTVWRPSTAIWYHHHRNGNTSAFQWGLPLDKIPQSVIRAQ